MTIRNPNDRAIAQKILDAYPDRRLSKSTQAKYRALGKRYFLKHAAVTETSSKRTYYVRKAALTFYAVEMLRASLDTDDEKLFAQALSTLLKFHTEDVPGSAMRQGRKCPISNPQPVRGKRKSLQGLPQNWIDMMLANLSGPKRDWLLVLSAAGVRPQELANGVKVTPHKSGVIFEVLGAKTGKGYGQPVRQFYVVSKFATELAASGPQTITAISANAVSAFVSKLGRKIFKPHEAIESVSAYTFRHQFSADLKATNLLGDEISAILGHSVNDTKNHYGVRVQSRGSIKVKLLFATRPVKHVAKTPLHKASPTL
jgi:integrase